MAVQLAGRDIYVNTRGQSQTVKICDCRNIRGEYEYYYRLRPPKPEYDQAKMVAALENHAANNWSLEQLVQWLQDLGAVDELAVDTVGLPAEGDEPPPSRPPLAMDVPEPWFTEARKAVERSIDALLDEFAAFPFAHRVEHCLHTRLVELCRDQLVIGGLHELENTSEKQWTQLVHKEWPETTARPEKNRRRGNFDVVVLNPNVVRACPSLVDFLEGRLEAPIVVELGLDYGLPALGRRPRRPSDGASRLALGTGRL
jgi:hypothetical protein